MLGIGVFVWMEHKKKKNFKNVIVKIKLHLGT